MPWYKFPEFGRTVKDGPPKRSPRNVMIGFAGVSALALGAFILGKQSMARRKKMELQCYRESIDKGRETGTPPG
ncbi:uncharacterized protein ARMOST_02067 [Armillaria ostoyae]|uniref:Uncharacterized protein n=1 Tax=Armillaria ostoyae TaxID=47428 RepID=A0A284QQR5_ARMOS|nr:uncharacterized protein ARMOST_02067 [Armillaria ostoyae]